MRKQGYLIQNSQGYSPSIMVKHDAVSIVTLAFSEVIQLPAIQPTQRYGHFKANFTFVHTREKKTACKYG